MRSITTFALSAVLAITFASCNRNQETRPQFVCYYSNISSNELEEDSAELCTFQIYRDIECPLPVNEAWTNIRNCVLSEAGKRAVFDTTELQKLYEYQAVVEKDTESTYAYQHNDYISLRTYHLDDSIYGYYCHTKWFDMGAHGTEGYYYRYFDLRTGRPIFINDLMNNDSVVTRYLDSTIRQSDIAWGLLVDTIKPNDNFIISNNGLTFVYNQYEIGCFAIDTVMCTVPLSILNPFLQPQWKYLWE